MDDKNKRTMRTASEITKTLSLILDTYEAYRGTLNMKHANAVKRTIESYDDFRDWCYYQGDFENDKKRKAKN